MATIEKTGEDVSVDETALLQNFSVEGSGSSTESSDVDDEDIDAALVLNSTPDGDALPDAFENRLAVLLVGDVNIATPVQVAVSGLSTTNTTGAPMFTIEGTYTDLAFTDSGGNALDGDASGLFSIDGTPIYLYTDSSNNNIVVGRKGQLDGSTLDPDDYIADPAGTIVFAAYLEETADGVKVWTVLRSPLNHDDGDPNTANLPDESVDLTDMLYVTATGQIDFVFEHLPAGQNVFLQFKDANTNIGIVITGMDPDQTTVGKNGQLQNDFDTVNTSQAADGDAATIATNNQSIDPAGGNIPDDEGMVFTFVNNPNADFTVPDLTQGEASNEANIQFGSLHETLGAQFDIAQVTPSNKLATVRVTALKETVFAQGAAFVDELLDDGAADDDVIDIISVTVYNASGAIVANNISASMGAPVNGIQVTFNGAATANTVTIAGLGANYSVAYTTGALHNRVLIENEGNSSAALNASFDIGGFHLFGSSTTSEEIGSLMGFEDDAPTIGTAQTGLVDEDGLTGGNTAAATGDVAGADVSDTGLLSPMFNAGNDGFKSFSLSNVQADIDLIAAYDPISDPTLTTPLALTSKGGTVVYTVDGNTLWGFVNGDSAGNDPAARDGNDRDVLKLVLSNTTNLATAAWTFTLLDQLDHPALNGDEDNDDTENDILLQLGSVLKISDVDDDFVTGAPGTLAVTVDDDSPDPLTPAGLTVHNVVDPTPLTPSATAALGSFGNVGADEDGKAVFVGTDGTVLQGDLVGNGVPAPENILYGGSNIYLFGFGSDTLVATSSSTNADPANNTVFVMTLNPDGSVEANDLYDITILKQIANMEDVPFGDFTSKVASGNPLFKLVEDIGGSDVDALFSGWIGNTQETVNIATVGVGVGGGQDFNANDRMQIQFLKDDGLGNSTVTDTEEQLVNRFTFIMNQNNPPQDDGDLTVRAYDASGTEVQITGILINGDNLVGGVDPGPVVSNDQEPGPGIETVTAAANGLGYDLHGLGGGTGGSTADNDDVTIITANGYVRLDILATGADTNKDTFDILLKSLAVPTARDVTFTVQAALVDEDDDASAPADLDVTLDADGVFATLVGTTGLDTLA